MDERHRGRVLHAVVVIGVFLGVCAVLFKTRDGSHPVADVVLTGLVGLLFLGAGVFAHRRRPDNNTGLLLVAVGVATFAEDLQLSRDPVTHTFGLLVAHVASPMIVHLVLAFPKGRLSTWPAKGLVIAAYLAALGLGLLRTLFGGSLPAGPRNLLAITQTSTLAIAVSQVLEFSGALIAISIVIVLCHRWLTGTSSTRQMLAPVLGVALAGATASAVASLLGPQHADYAMVLTGAKIALCLWPLAFAVGVLRTGPRPAAVTDLLVALRDPLTPGQLRDLLAQTLRDPSLRLWLWHPPTRTFRDVDRAPVDTEAQRDLVTYVDYHGRRIAALVSRDTSWEDQRLLGAVGMIAGLVVDSQLRAEEEQDRLAEVRASRARLLELADAERQRVERDLHDGAQQRLVAVALGLRLAQQRLGTGTEELAALLNASVDEVDAAMAELRDLARGIHPAILTQAGLVPAVAALVERTPLPIELSASSVPRLPATIEATGYFVAAEAVTNALKHSGAELIEVEVALDNGSLYVRVTDDGAGGADLCAGSGLRGLRDRVQAIGGDLTITSVSSKGTTVEAAIPTGGGHG
ncbi:signal transduction histidine kinase [Kibdelosporangium banguiense]|uniref:histidine kinase n=1 Tax=Kibdelosporangium banguiense TaxID=1365924 RepID=A0ABS4TMS7_9PSEU|nr:sensor histidine kinase [Kibdelosporangium banguiense]MBP2325708.1 signal transduction histidine kinase [Kibdelosporangium banguiense]